MGLITLKFDESLVIGEGAGAITIVNCGKNATLDVRCDAQYRRQKSNRQKMSELRRERRVAETDQNT